VLFNPFVKSGPDYELHIFVSDLFMVFGKDDKVEEKFADVRS